MRDRDKWKIAFSTSCGHYEYCVMPYGFSRAPAVFQSFINDVLRNISSTPPHARPIFSMFAKPFNNSPKTNCSLKERSAPFTKFTISFLGYIISSDGVSMDPAKISAITEWPTPRTIKELQQFLGFANFY